MKPNIILTGLMGAGKTSVGKILTSKLSDFTFIDIDEQIEQPEGITISKIFETKSEKYFRQLETNTIKHFSEKRNQIISLGGGALENELNRQYLFNSGIVFYLYATTDVLYNRIKKQSNRPLLLCDNPKQKLEELLKQREINYKKANVIIDTTNKSFNEITDEIIRKISCKNHQ